MSHTKGPWNLVWWGNEQYPFPLSILANNDGAWVSRGGEVSSEANARLIAAAPDLLEAAHEAELQIQYMHRMFGETGTGNNVLAQLAAAISKATGAA